jgi:hypothetical protein
MSQRIKNGCIGLIIVSFLLLSVSCDPVPADLNGPDQNTLPTDGELVGLWIAADGDHVNFINNFDFQRWADDDFVHWGKYEIVNNNIHFDLQGYLTNARKSRITYGDIWFDAWVVEYDKVDLNSLIIADHEYQKSVEFEAGNF